jgi:hypothetical protein
LVDGGEDLLRLAAAIKPAPQFVGVTVQHGLVSFDIDERVLRLREEPRALFEVEFLAVPEAKGKEMVVRGLPVEVEHNLAGVPA